MQFGRILFEILLRFVTALHKYDVGDLSSVASRRARGCVKEAASAKCNLASVCLCVIFRISLPREDQNPDVATGRCQTARTSILIFHKTDDYTKQL